MSKLNVRDYLYLIGMTVEHAEADLKRMAIAQGNTNLSNVISIREVETDGNRCFVSYDISYRRINVCVEDGKIKSIDGAY